MAFILIFSWQLETMDWEGRAGERWSFMEKFQL